MGSKQSMLLNGLGDTILEHGSRSNRIVDLFSGSGAVAWFAAEALDIPVVAVDLQEYAAVMAASVIGRTHAVDPSRLVDVWISPAKRAVGRSSLRKLWEPLEPRNVE